MNNKIYSLTIFCHTIHRHGLSSAYKYLDIELISINKYDQIQDLILSYYSLYQCCLGRNKYIDNLFTMSELQNIFNLIKTLDIINLQLVKQIIIMRIRKCTISK